ncbi:MAG: hypothetical protein WDW36_009787 [Sanguina aurantia]
MNLYGPFPGQRRCSTSTRTSASASSSGASAEEAEQYRRELHSLNVAIGANILIFLAKIWVHNLTGSSAILAEAMHSVADILNQVLLRIGVQQAQRVATPLHPYGFLRDRFVWSLISAVGIFFLGAGASILHGLHTLASPTWQPENVEWSYAVLAVSGILEGYSLWVASHYISVGAKAKKMGMLEYIKKGADPTTVAVMLEDGGAVLGLAIAGACTGLAHATNNGMWDAAGSLLVGLLLGAIAVFLVQRNRQLLIGRSMGAKEVEEVLGMLKRDPVVSYVLDTKTEEIGPQVYRFKAEVAWDGDKVVERYLARCSRTRLAKQLSDACADPDPAALDAVLKAYGRDIISAVGAEVDRIESDIQRLQPGIRYVDLETDRGRQEGRLRSDKTGSLDSMDSMDLDCEVYSVVPGVPLPSLTSSGSSSESDDWDSNAWVNSDSGGGSSGGGGVHNSGSGSDGSGSSNGSSSSGHGSPPTGAAVHQGEVIAIHTRTSHVSMFDHDNSNSMKTTPTTSSTNTSIGGSQINGGQSNVSGNEHSQARRVHSEPRNGSSSADRSEIGAVFVESHGGGIPICGHPPLSPR